MNLSQLGAPAVRFYHSAVSILLLVPTIVEGQSAVTGTFRLGSAVSLEQNPGFDHLVGEAGISLRLGRHTSLGLLIGSASYGDQRRVSTPFYDPISGGLELVCPDPCTDLPIRRTVAYTDLARSAVLSFRISPGSPRRFQPWVELGLGAYRLGERRTDIGLPLSGGTALFHFDRVDWGLGPGASLGIGGDWFPSDGRIGVSLMSRLHGALATHHGELVLGALVSFGVGVVFR